MSFGLNGVSYEIDLGPDNKVRLQEAITPFIAAGRRLSRGGGQRSGARPSRSSADLGAVRAWAREAGLNVSERGRISAEVMSRYDAAH